MQIKFYSYFFREKHRMEVLLGTVLFLILIVSTVQGSTSYPPELKSEMEQGALFFSTTIPTLSNEKISSSNSPMPGVPPIAHPDTVVVLQGTSVNGNVLTNDFDPDGDALVLNTTPTILPDNGTVTLNADGSFTYVPYPFFVGTDQFTYQICDGASVPVTNSYSAGDVPVMITEFGTPTVTSTITVPSGGSIIDVNISNVFIEHSYVNDMVVTLTSPSGTVVTLFDQLWCADENVDLGFDDESGSTYGTIPCPPDDGGIYQPFEALSTFDNENSTGDWVLTISDVEFWDGGFLDNWELEITALGAGGNVYCVETTVTAIVYSSSSEICNNEIDDDGDGLIDVFDPDCPCEDNNFLGFCEPQCEYVPPIIPNFDIALEWKSVDSVNTFTTVTGADLDGDPSSVELVTVRGTSGSYAANAILVLDGSSGATKYTFNSKSIHQLNKGLALADVDKDGRGEIYYMIGNSDASDYRKIACYEYNPAATNLGGTGIGTFELKWISDQRVACGLAYPYNTITDRFAVNLADFNNDGFSEIYVGNEIFDAMTGTRVATGGANNIGNNIYDLDAHVHYHANPVAVDAIPTNDCANCKGLELVAGNQVYSVDIASGTMTVERDLAAAPGYQDGPVSIVDYDLDGDVDAVITTTDVNGSYLYIWDLQTENLIGNVHTISNVPINSIWYRSASNATVADFDGDNKPEIGVCGNNVFQVVEDYQFNISGLGGVAWSIATTDRSGMTGATSFDFNADGLTEVVYRDEDNLRIISGSTGINLATFPCGSATGGEYPIVLDIDRDGETELVCTCGDESYAYNGFVKAFRSNVFPWVPTRAIWNQYAYFVTNINENLSIPPMQQPHHLVGSPPLGTTGRLNNFLKQIGPFDNEGNAVHPAADVYANILDAGGDDCVTQDSLTLTIRFYNNGDLSFPALLPFAVYEGNPEVSATLVGAYTIPVAVIPGDSADVSIKIAYADLTLPSNLFVIGNDDGSLSLPLSLATDFPVTNIGECEFFNNMDSIPVNGCETVNPVLANIPANITVECDAIPSAANVTALDNCTPNLTVNFTENIGTGCPYMITRTWTATDDCGNQTTATQIITVEDTTNPVLVNVPNNITVECDAIPTAANVTANDNCTANINVVFTENIGTGCPYTITRTWTATDDCGNQTTASQVITVEDTMLPILVNVPSDTTVDCGAIPAAAVVTATDNCTNNLTVNFTENIGIGCPYMITRTWTVTDDCGNEPTASQVITVDDTTHPVFSNIPNDVTVECDAIPAVANVTASDNCTANLPIEFTETRTYGCPYYISRVWKVVDACGNETIANQLITVEDTTFPILVNVPNDVTVDCASIPSAANVTVNDNCTPNLTVNFTENIGTGCPYTITRTWTATDSCNNMVIEQQNILVEDTTLPTFAGVPSDITVDCTTIPDTATVTVNDDCSAGLQIVFTENIGTGCPYTITRTWTATDDCGNTDSVVQVITVEDNDAPLLVGVPSDVTVSCEAIPPPANITVNDSCWNDLTAELSEVTSSGCPYTITRTWTATDSCGNSTTATQVVTVEDNEPPVLQSPPADMTLDCGDVIPAPAELTATDNCSGELNGGVMLIEDIDYSESISEGCPYTIIRTWTAYDDCDNESTVTQVITVIDDTQPVLFNLPPDLTLDCGMIPDTQMVVAVDDCDADLDMVFEETYSDSTCENTFKITRTWTFTDNCGNLISHTQNIQIQDTIPPVFTGVPSDILLPCDSIPEMVAPIATDNCSTVDIVFSETEILGSCIDIRLMTRTWTATDVCGNVSTVSQNIVFNNCSPDATMSITTPNIVCKETEVTFEVSLTDGYDTPFYQWQYSQDGIIWTDIAGANASIYTIMTVAANTGMYQVVVANNINDIGNPQCSITSNVQVLTVIDQEVTVETLDVNLCQGDSIVFGNATYYQTGIFADTLDAATGCDSAIINLNLVIHEPFNLNIDSTICEGDSVLVGATSYTQNGVFVNNLSSIYGCDSIVTLNLTVNPVAHIVLDEAICDGENFMVGNNPHSSTGTYVDTLSALTGCDSIVVLNLIVNDVPKNSLAENICEGDAYVVGSSIYTQTGIYKDTLTTINGCDSIITLDLTVHEIYAETIVAEICDGENYPVGDSLYSVSGNYVTNLQTIYGCDSIVTLNLTVNPIYAETIIAEICDGENYVVGDSTYTASGNFVTNLTTTNGCDSIVTLDLTVNPIYSETIIAEICDGENYSVGDSTYTTSGNFVTNLTTINGCDSIITLDLTVHEIYSETITAEICDGETYEIGDSTYSATGSYIQNYVTVNGCDSIVTLDLTVLPALVTILDEFICSGQTFTMGGVSYSETGTYIDTLQSSAGCDSLVTLNLVVDDILEINLTESICQGESFVIGSSVYTETGIYADTMQTMGGCDSLVILDLTVLDTFYTAISGTICQGEIYEAGGSDFTTSGIYTLNLQTINGCDSTVVLDLTVNDSYNDALSERICFGETYTLGDSTFNATGVYDILLTSVDGCDSLINLTLTVDDDIQTNLTEVLCFGATYELGDSIYTTTGIYNNTFTSINGCDSLVVLDLTVGDEVLTNIAEELCFGATYELGDSIYTTTGIYNNIFTNINGCDSTVVLDLIVHSAIEDTIDAFVCEGSVYEMGDSIYTTSGIYNNTFTSVDGCDSTVILILTVSDQILIDFTERICFGETYELGDSIYTTSGIYTQNYITVSGCDSTVVLDLTIVPEIENTITTTICEGSTYEVGGNIYTTSGIYNNTLTSVDGCDSLVILDLMVVSSVAHTLDATICDGDTYVMEGVNYQTSGVYVDTLVAASGCDSVLTLNLTVAPSYQMPISAIICENEGYQVGNVVYTESGMYVDTLTSVSGCDSVIMLSLNIIPVAEEIIEATICVGETYQVGNNFYSTSGTFTENYPSPYGCDSIVTLILTVADVQPTVVYQNLCEGDSIVLAGAYQTEGGIYTDILQSTSGCDSFIYTYLTLVDDATTYVQEVICEGDSILIAGAYRYEAGEFTTNLTTSLGCDSTVITELLVDPPTELYAEDIVLCLGEEGQIFVEGATDVKWSPTQGLSCDDCPNPYVTPSSTTTYKVTTPSCLGAMVETSVTVYVNMPPVLYVSDDVTIIKGETIKLMASSDDMTDKITWMEGSRVLCDNCREINVSPEKTTTYFVTTIDENGCEATEEVTVKVNDGCQAAKLNVPNMISPNGDGYNDYFEIQHEGFTEIKLLKIYNRWGEVVFETNDVDHYWDGTFRGKELNPGVYVYYIEGVCLNEEAFMYTGNVTILK